MFKASTKFSRCLDFKVIINKHISLKFMQQMSLRHLWQHWIIGVCVCTALEKSSSNMLLNSEPSYQHAEQYIMEHGKKLTSVREYKLLDFD